MFCKKCGQEVKEGAKFCPKCGNMMSVTPEPTGKSTGNIGMQPIAFKPMETETQAKRKADTAKTSVVKKSIFMIGAAALVVAVCLLFYIFYFQPKAERDKAYAAADECLSTLESGDIEKALSYTDYAEDMSLSEYILSTVTTSGSTAVSDDADLLVTTLLCFMEMEESWGEILDYGLENALRDYEIADVQVDRDTAVVKVEITCADYAAAAESLGENLLDFLENTVVDSYADADWAPILKSVGAAILTRTPIMIANALREVAAPIYKQLPEQIKTQLGSAKEHTVTVRLEMEKVDGQWIIKSDKHINAAVDYTVEVCDTLLSALLQ